MRTVLKHVTIKSANGRSCLMHIKVTVVRHWYSDSSSISRRQDCKILIPAVCSSDANYVVKSASNSEISDGSTDVSLCRPNDANGLGLPLAAASSPGGGGQDTLTAAPMSAASQQQGHNAADADDSEAEGLYSVSSATSLQEESAEGIQHPTESDSSAIGVMDDSDGGFSEEKVESSDSAYQLTDTELPVDTGEINSVDEVHELPPFTNEGVEGIGEIEWEFEDESSFFPAIKDLSRDSPKDKQMQKFYRAIYDKAGEPATRLHHTIMSPHYPRPDMNTVRSNLKLIKARRHPKQLLNEDCRLKDMGIDALHQILRRHAIKKYRDYLNSGKCAPSPGSPAADADYPASRPPPPPAYPELLTFQLRVKKELSHLRWKEYVHSRTLASKRESKEFPKRLAIKDSHMYRPEHIDAWTNCVKVVVKSQANFDDIILPAFSRLGLDFRADFKFTIGCFIGDRRRTGASDLAPKNPVEVFGLTPVRLLYRRNASEIFVNSNKMEIYSEFPELFDPGPKPKVIKVKRPADSKGKTKCGGGCC